MSVMHLLRNYLPTLLLSLFLCAVGEVIRGQESSSPYAMAPGGLSPNSYPLDTPPPPLPNGSIDLNQPIQLQAKTPSVTEGVGPEFQWYNPWTWVPRDGWTNSAELGINGSDGNSESFSFQTGARFKRKGVRNLFELRMTHNRTQTGGIESQNNALLFVDHEYLFKESRWSWFDKFGLEYDEFKAFDVRINMNTGLGYRWVDSDKLRLTSRFGAGTSREIGGPDDRWVPEAVFGGDYDHQINSRNKLTFKVDYFPEWTDFSNYRFVGDAGWEYLLDEKGNLSLKLGANDRYDSTPNGRRPNDINYTFLVLYKF